MRHNIIYILLLLAVQYTVMHEILHPLLQLKPLVWSVTL